MTFQVINPRIGVQPIAETSTVQKLPLGTRVQAQDAVYGVGEFIYLQGLASTGVGEWVTFNQDDGTTTLLAANAIGPVALAMSANLANQFGWYQVYGKGVGKVLALFADNANVYATSTAGTVDDAPVAGDRVKNARGASAIGTPAAGLAEMELWYPFMDDALAA
jgi:hypothetical protein